ncbi:efflux RND transporter periplasmic adaptor subunit [Adhaeribacter aquaticus]|uniref:efflux RND transporter periplasmic adaptor subunit n=1 Tax=Adhaeribacter aquaticus TaxID=299567 RepID=UPI0004278181|nr:efflux RND transporter periplasmic adaptor subunit [Adhaeribacter aquaticus]
MKSNFFKNSIYKSLAGLSCGLLLAFSLPACNSSDAASEEKAENMEDAAVETIKAEKGKLSTSLSVPGELLPFHQVDLYAKETSFVREVLVDIGTEVKKGQLLASLDAPELNARIAEAESRLKSQEAIYTASKAQYNRIYETSKTPGTISQNELDQALAKKNSDYAQLEAARAAYRGVAQTKNYLEIRAPFNGVVTSRNISQGAYVGPSGKGSDKPLLVVQDQKRLRLVVSVPEAYAGYLKQEDEVDFSVKSLPNQEFKAKVKRMAGSLDSRLRAERLEMDVFNPDKKLMPGMYAEVHLPLPSKDSTFVVPRSALVVSTEKIFVIRVNNNKAEWVNVQKGREADDKIEVYGDLNRGDQLVAVASEEIRNGSDLKQAKLRQ